MEMHRLLETLFREQCRAVLATVVDVEGHAYRSAGASMLLLGNGSRYGSISPGCLEEDLGERVEGILQRGKSELVEYEMRPSDDLSWGEIIGCGGLIRVLLEPVRGKLLHQLVTVKRRLDLGERVLLRRTFAGSYTEAEYRILEPGPGPAEDRAELRASAAGPELDCSYAPMPRLLLFGAADDAVPVAAHAARCGFRVIAADWRSGLLTAQRFPDAERLLSLPQTLFEEVRLREDDYVVVMSHHYAHDLELLRQLLDRTVHYAGVMGSASRTERLLADAGRRAPAWLHYPVGLDIGAAGPEEIAISIAAELIDIRRGQLSLLPAEWTGRRDKHDYGHLFGRRGRLPNGRRQAFPGAGRIWKARRLRP